MEHRALGSTASSSAEMRAWAIGTCGSRSSCPSGTSSLVQRDLPALRVGLQDPAGQGAAEGAGEQGQVTPLSRPNAFQRLETPRLAARCFPARVPVAAPAVPQVLFKPFSDAEARLGAYGGELQAIPQRNR